MIKIDYKAMIKYNSNGKKLEYTLIYLASYLDLTKFLTTLLLFN